MTLNTHYLYKLPLCWPHLIFFQVTLYLTSNGWRMDSCWCLTDATKFCLTAVSSRFLGPKLQTLAGTAAWPLTVQGIAADTSTSTSWVQTNTTLFNPMRIIFRNNQTISDESHVLMLYSLFFLPVSPTIGGSGPDGSSEEVTVTLSSPTSLLCEVQSYPPALITWLKDGTPFESSRSVRVLPGLKSHAHNNSRAKENTVLQQVHLCNIHQPCVHRWANTADSQC